jgi:hypothetical protein
MALDLELLTSLISAIWENPNPLTDPIAQIAEAFEQYWAGASITVPNQVDPVLVTPISGIMIDALDPLRTLPGTPESASEIFYGAWVELIQASTWIQPAFEPNIPNPVTLHAEVNPERLDLLILPIIETPKSYVPSTEFCAEIHTWCRGTTVESLDENGDPVTQQVV